MAVGDRVLIDASRTLTDREVWTVLSFDESTRAPIQIDWVETIDPDTLPPKANDAN